MTFAYVSSPYSHPESAVREERYLAVRNFVTHLLEREQWCYSPIVHCHYIALDEALPTDFEYWKRYNDTMQAASAATYILGLDGWLQSKGVRHEINRSRELGLQIKLFEPVVYEFVSYL